MSQSFLSGTSPKRVGTKPKPPAVSPKIRPQTLDAAYMTPDELLLWLKTSEDGITDVEASNRLAEHGQNEVAYDRAVPAVWQFFRNFGNPFVALLSALSLISFLLADIAAGSLILLMVLISVLLRFIQEFRSTRTVARLRTRVGTTVTVSRIKNAGERKRDEIPLREIVPGDSSI